MLLVNVHDHLSKGIKSYFVGEGRDKFEQLKNEVRHRLWRYPEHGMSHTAKVIDATEGTLIPAPTT